MLVPKKTALTEIEGTDEESVGYEKASDQQEDVASSRG